MVMLNRTPCPTPNTSTIPRREKKELVIKMISKNNWRVSSESKEADVSKEEKSSEELALDREAAEAVIRGDFKAIMSSH